MKSAGDLVRILIEFTTCVKHGHDDLQGAHMLLGMNINGDTAAIILDRDGPVGVDRQLYMGTKSSQCLIDRIVYRLVDQLMQTLLTDVTYVHRGTLSDGLQSLQDLNVAG